MYTPPTPPPSPDLLPFVTLNIGITGLPHAPSHTMICAWADHRLSDLVPILASQLAVTPESIHFDDADGNRLQLGPKIQKLGLEEQLVPGGVGYNVVVVIAGPST
ncbi:hypothetical protein FN846DRAFT_910743 [Sphaerosporella brunnea]|uniref:Uncharacterized protein n=1 Tax=Sphaerosporella brunnea TaxID=1250544 RepID=A0A5J5EL65_9PEZI|nr:hypothetical protein FN846DRAFT_910743 [Sphaerosporella brunnea]